MEKERIEYQAPEAHIIPLDAEILLNGEGGGDIITASLDTNR